MKIKWENALSLEYSLNNGDVLSIRSIVEEYDKVLLGHNISDDRSYSRKRKIWKENILQRIPQAEIQHRISTNTPECIFQNIHKGLILEAAIENAECQENSLKRMWSVAKELREDSLSFIRSCKFEFDGEVKPESLRQPALLVSFLKWFLTGVKKQIDGERGKHLHSVVRSLADTLLYNMKTKRQVDYLPQTDVSFKHTNENLHVIGMGLATRQFGRSKANVNLLHGYGVSMSNTRALQIETSLANAVIDNMRLNQGVLHLVGFQKGSPEKSERRIQVELS